MSDYLNPKHPSHHARTVSYGRVVSLGNYQTERCEMTVEVLPNETTEQAFFRVKQMVHEALGLWEYQPKEREREREHEAKRNRIWADNIPNRRLRDGDDF